MTISKTFKIILAISPLRSLLPLDYLKTNKQHFKDSESFEVARPNQKICALSQVDKCSSLRDFIYYFSLKKIMHHLSISN